MICVIMQKNIFIDNIQYFMARANIETSSGLKITIEGTAEEIASIVAHVKSEENTPQLQQTTPERKYRRSESAPTSLVGLIQELKENGFFDTPKKVKDVKDALAQQTHHYPLESISTTLIRRVKQGELGRIKEEKMWVYVKR